MSNYFRYFEEKAIDLGASKTKEGWEYPQGWCKDIFILIQHLTPTDSIERVSFDSLPKQGKEIKSTTANPSANPMGVYKNIPPGEIRMNSQGAQRAGAYMAGAYMSASFEARREIIADRFPGWEKVLRSDFAAAWDHVARSVYENAILMGPTLTYKKLVDGPAMLKWAQLGATVVQKSDYEAWVFPGQPAKVVSQGYMGDPNGSGRFPFWAEWVLGFYEEYENVVYQVIE